MDKEENTSDVNQKKVDKCCSETKRRPYLSMSELERRYKRIQKLDLGLLLSGLTILVKDTAYYLNSQGVDGKVAEGFRHAHLDMLNHDRYYWEKFGGLLYQPLAKYLDDFADETEKNCGCKKELKPLNHPDWEKEWLRAPGWYFLKAYSMQRREDILRDISLEDLKTAFCKGENPYVKPAPAEIYLQGDEAKRIKKACDPFVTVEAVLKRLIGTERHVKNFWSPVMLYLVVLLQKTNFITLEEAE